MLSSLPFVLKAELVGNGRGLFSVERDGLVKTQEKYGVGDEGDRYWFAKRLSENPELQNGDRVRIRDIVEELCWLEEGRRRRVRQEDMNEAVKDEPGLVTICLADVTPTTVEWLWENRIPLGKLSILFGLPGEGKSFVSLDIGARVSAGRPWPNRRFEKVERVNVLLLSCEDGLADTIVHRLINAEADLDQITFIEGVKRPEAKGEVLTFSDRFSTPNAIDCPCR